ncbi:MAG: PGF-pre-PGF domain-containing protein [Candidatus Woesearchaeota archaeon]
MNINSVTVDEPDTFYSNYTGNNIVNLRVVLTNINATSGNVVSSTADFSNLGVICKGQSGYVINLTNAGGGVWTGSCDISDAASATTFKSGPVLVNAMETYGPTSPQGSIILSIYNIGIPSGNSCYRFADGSTNFIRETNFNSINIVLVAQAYGGSSCVPKGISWGNDWLTIGKLTFTNVNLANPSQAQKLTQLSDIVKVQFSPTKTYQNSRIMVNTSQLPELGTTSVFEMYHLHFISQGVVLSDNTVPAQAVNWVNTGFDSIMNTTTFNLTFTVTPGFAGYTVTDAVIPRITISSPIPGQSYNGTSVVFSAAINGTGTSVSKILFHVNGNMIASYDDAVGTVNTANCTSSTPEMYSCLFALNQSDGNYNLSVVAYDYGGSSGNIANSSLNYVIQTGPPKFSVSSPKDGEEYSGNTGSMLNMRFNVSDGNGINSCWYELSGSTDVDKTYLINCSKGVDIQLYLSSGSYDLELYANDTLGMISEDNVGFSVSDDVPPKITDMTNFTGSRKVRLSVLTDESAKCKYDIFDTSYNRMEYSFSDNAVLHIADLELDRDYNYFYYVRCEDLSDNPNTASVKISIVYDNSTMNESIGMEEAEIIGELSDSIENFDMGFLPAGMKIININNENIPMTDILLKTTGGADDVKIVVASLSNVSNHYSGIVYKYVDITHNALRDSLISDAKIKFKVAKKWLEDKQVIEDKILLWRFDGVWNEINTTIVKNDEDYVYYTADSPGLSLFAISTRAPVVDVIIAEQEVVSLQSGVSENISSLGSEESLEGQEKDEGNHFSWIWLIVGIVVFILAVLFILFERNNHSGPPPIFPRERSLIGRMRRLFR